jgi:hypothetical protein
MISGINYFLGSYFGVCCNGLESRVAAAVRRNDPGRKSLLPLAINFTSVPPAVTDKLSPNA